MKLKLKQNIGMSVHIDIEVTESEIKNKKCSNGKWNQNEIKLNQNIGMNVSIAA